MISRHNGSGVITSVLRDLDGEALGRAVRAHWGIENRLHWVLDVGFGEDASTVRKDYAPQNLSLLKRWC